VPGEELRHPLGREFVAWYNAHPDFRDRRFGVSQERAAIVGVGNVAIDVGVCCRTRRAHPPTWRITPSMRSRRAPCAT
jgi:ferredoxin--NADP+ reductase